MTGNGSEKPTRHRPCHPDAGGTCVETLKRVSFPTHSGSQAFWQGASLWFRSTQQGVLPQRSKARSFLRQDDRKRERKPTRHRPCHPDAGGSCVETLKRVSFPTHSGSQAFRQGASLWFRSTQQGVLTQRSKANAATGFSVVFGIPAFFPVKTPEKAPLPALIGVRLGCTCRSFFLFDFDDQFYWGCINSMKSIETTYISPFNTKRISFNKMIHFTSDHLERAIEHNTDGWFSDRIAATTAAYSVFEDAYTRNLTDLAQRKSQKIVKTRFREQLADEVSRIVANVVAIHGEGSSDVTKLIPHGRTAFSHASDDLIENYLETLISGLMDQEPPIDGAVIAKAQQLKVQWVQIYEASEASTAKKAASESERRAAREALQRELFLNLLELAKRYPDQPEYAGLYMQQHLLGYRRGKRSTTQPAGIPAQPTGSSSVSTSQSSSGSSSSASSSSSATSSSGA